jgi:CHAT domain-containing protein/Tfp pilus assembly protein PilF
MFVLVRHFACRTLADNVADFTLRWKLALSKRYNLRGIHISPGIRSPRADAGRTRLKRWETFMRMSPLYSPDRRRRPRLGRWPVLALLAAVVFPSGSPVHGGDLPELTAGEAQTRELGAGEVHRYPFSLAAGELLRAVVSEDGVDVGVLLLGPRGERVAFVDGPFAPQDDEDLAAIAERAGLYQLEVRGGRNPGHYRIRIERRPAGDEDRARVEAVRLTQTANDLIGKPEALPEQVEKRQRALALWHQLGERGHEAAALYQLGRARFVLGDYGAAADALHQAAALWRDLGAGLNQADALNESGRADGQADRRDEAREHYEQALALLEAPAADPLLKARVLNNLGYVLSDLGEPRAAIERLEEALALARLSRQRSAVETQFSILNNLGGAYADLSLSHEALTFYQRCLDLAPGQISPQRHATVLNNIGLLYDSLGDGEKAIRYYQDALAIDRDQNDGPDLARTFNNLGLAHDRAQHGEQARRAYDQALLFARKSGERRTEAQALYNLGYLEIGLGHPSRAVELCRQALALAVGDREIEAAARTAMGAAYRELGQLDAATTELTSALAISRERGDGIREANVRLNLARVARARGDLNGAIAFTGEAIDLVESVRTRVASPDLRASFLASVQSYYELDIDSLMAGGHAAEALGMSERARARSFLELLNSSGAILSQEVPAELTLRERQASDALSVAEKRRAKLVADPRADPASVAAAIRRREEAVEKYQQVEGDVRAASPRYASLTQPIGLPEIEKLLDGGTLLLEYALGEKRSYLWVVTPTGIRSFRLPPRARIEKVARRFYEQVTRRSRGEVSADRLARADAAAAVAARELSQLVLAPAAGLLKDRRLVVVSDGALQYIPFAALPEPSGGTSRAKNATAAALPYLVERHEILSLPSASVLSVLRRQLAQRPPPRRTLAVIADPVFQPGDPRVRKRPSVATVEPAESNGTDRECGSQTFPRLPFSGEEEKAIASLVPKAQRLEAFGFDASLAMVRSGALSRYGLVHFATHGCIDNRHPELSGLVLSQVDPQGRPQDGLLWLKDIYDLHLNADLVVLSACQTALGKEIQGEGLVGLTRGFLYAGSARVVASLWKVQDRPTYQLMKRFYGAMLGTPPQRSAAALRQAQLDLAKDQKFASPYFWAGFSLQGEWR